VNTLSSFSGKPSIYGGPSYKPTSKEHPVPGMYRSHSSNYPESTSHGIDPSTLDRIKAEIDAWKCYQPVQSKVVPPKRTASLSKIHIIYGKQDPYDKTWSEDMSVEMNRAVDDINISSKPFVGAKLFKTCVTDTPLEVEEREGRDQDTAPSMEFPPVFGEEQVETSGKPDDELADEYRPTKVLNNEEEKTILSPALGSSDGDISNSPITATFEELPLASDRTKLISPGESIEKENSTPPSEVKFQEGTEQVTPESSAFQEGTEQVTPEFSTFQEGTEQVAPEFSTFQEGTEQVTPEFSAFQEGTEQVPPEFSTFQEGTEQVAPESSAFQEGTEQVTPEFSTFQEGTEQIAPEFSTFQEGTEQVAHEFSTFQEGTEQVAPEFSTFQEGTEQVSPEFSTFQEGTEQVTPEFSAFHEGNEEVTPEFSTFQEDTEQVTPEFRVFLEGTEQVTPEFRAFEAESVTLSCNTPLQTSPGFAHQDTETELTSLVNSQDEENYIVMLLDQSDDLVDGEADTICTVKDGADIEEADADEETKTTGSLLSQNNDSNTRDINQLLMELMACENQHSPERESDHLAEVSCVEEKVIASKCSQSQTLNQQCLLLDDNLMTVAEDEVSPGLYSGLEDVPPQCSTRSWSPVNNPEEEDWEITSSSTTSDDSSISTTISVDLNKQHSLEFNPSIETDISHERVVDGLVPPEANPDSISDESLVPNLPKSAPPGDNCSRISDEHVVPCLPKTVPPVITDLPDVFDVTEVPTLPKSPPPSTGYQSNAGMRTLMRQEQVEEDLILFEEETVDDPRVACPDEDDAQDKVCDTVVPVDEQREPGPRFAPLPLFSLSITRSHSDYFLGKRAPTVKPFLRSESVRSLGATCYKGLVNVDSQSERKTKIIKSMSFSDVYLKQTVPLDIVKERTALFESRASCEEMPPRKPLSDLQSIKQGMRGFRNEWEEKFGLGKDQSEETHDYRRTVRRDREAVDDTGSGPDVSHIAACTEDIPNLHYSSFDHEFTTERERFSKSDSSFAGSDSTSGFLDVPSDLDDTASPLPPAPLVIDEQGVMEVHLIKGATGLGFCIEGGMGSLLGDVPVRIKRLFKSK
jgi:hypothetical protein